MAAGGHRADGRQLPAPAARPSTCSPARSARPSRRRRRRRRATLEPSARAARAARSAPGTADLSRRARPCPRAEARAALDVGAEVAARPRRRRRAVPASPARWASATPRRRPRSSPRSPAGPPAEVTGRGTGIDDATLARKVAVVEAALAPPRGRRRRRAASRLLAAVGGLEIAALAGFVVGGAAAGVPVVVDGVIADAALLVAARARARRARPACVAGHRSAEPGAHRRARRTSASTPLLDLGLRLGEGTGACLAVPAGARRPRGSSARWRPSTPRGSAPRPVTSSGAGIAAPGGEVSPG